MAPDISEKAGPKLSEIGVKPYNELVIVLKQRETHPEWNMAGWGGAVADLEKAVDEKRLCPGSVFGVVAKGFFEYRRPQGVSANDESDSLFPFSKALAEGSGVFARAREVDEQTLKQQMKEYIVAHGGSFDENIDWPDFIKNAQRH